ncbi:MAG: hypothetical protein U5L96_11105 [Owenweeksia sp.]|nr:hypothetical protein [Owenweeksia sp.]
MQDGRQLPEYYSLKRDFDHPNVVAKKLFSTRFTEDHDHEAHL